MSTAPPVPEVVVPLRGKSVKYNPTLRERIDDQIHIHVGSPDNGVLKPETRFVEDLGADSLIIAELFCALEDEFEINLPDEEVDDIIFVQDIYKLIEKRVKK